MRDLGVVEGGCVAARRGRIVFAGPRADFEREVALAEDAVILDATDRVVLPGFVDAHTHLAFAGSRHDEFARRLEGATYEEIAALGGGILATVRATRGAAEEELDEAITGRLDRMLLHGTTTCEAKSGYGLTPVHELKLLEAISRAAAAHPVGIVGTLLGAHAVPPEHRQDRAAYVRLVAEQMVPAAAQAGLARYCDVFCERTSFTVEESRTILRAGRAHGLAPRVHADQLSDSGGAALAAELGAASADHLDHVSEEGVRALAAAGVAAGLLPGASFCLRAERHAPARRLVEAGVPVFLATDLNPGTSYTESLSMIAALGCLLLDLSVEEALAAETLNGAASLGLAAEIGSLEAGKRADFVVLDVPHYAHVVYHFGVNHVGTVVKDGRVVVEDGILVYDEEG
jgi:imidazolonepropionase